ncbi:MAG: translocation/assembly module TamB domain-containing protein [Hyphomonadaceae bacterium]|nr:translocation/assembly module TamB domain-containing protein [Hyphomonadaceae bacterium]
MAARPISRRALAYAAGAALVLGGVVAGLGPAAPWVIDQLADDQRVWRLGRISIDGVEGEWLGSLRAEHIRIADADGVWFEADNVTLNWRPQSLLGGGVWIDAANAEAARILRQPKLSPARPASGGIIDVHIAALNIDDLDLAEAVVGEEARFTANLSMDLREETLRSIDLSLRRTDSEADNVTVLYRASEYAMLVNVAGPAGGVLSNLLGVPEQSVRIQAVGDGDLENGGARYEGYIGEEQLLTGETRWTQTHWTSQGQARLDLLPGLANIARRIGASTTLNASGERPTEAAPGSFQAEARTPFFATQLSGRLNAAFELDGPARIVATTERLSDIARESPFELGAARLEGELRQANGVSATRATIDARNMEVLGRVAHFSGPVQASLSRAEFELTADLRAAADSPDLFRNARLRTTMNVDRSNGRYTLARTTLEGDAIALDAQGWANDGDGEFSGEWRVKQLGALADGLTGGGAGRWRAHAEPLAQSAGHAWIAAIDGNGDRIGGSPDIIPQLVGPSPRLDGLFRYEAGVIHVNHIRVDGRQLRAAATGQITRGDANLALEASARGPLDLGGAEIGGAVDATGRLTGRLAAPTLTARAQMSSFAASGVVVEQPQVDFTLAPSGRGYRGQAEVTGNVSGQVLTASSDVSVFDGALGLTNLVANAGQLEARGSASIASRGMSAELALNGKLDGLADGVRGTVDGALSLSPQALALDAELTNARMGDLVVRTARVSADGPTDAIQAHYDMRGALRQAPLTFAGTALIATARGVTQAQVQGQGALAGAPLATRTPITAQWRNGGVEIGIDVTLADGALTATWTDQGRTLAGQARVTNASLGPLATIYGEEATGRIDGEANIANTGGGLRGAANLRFEDARFAGRQRGLLDLHVVGQLEPSHVTATINATSTEGLVARFEANAPVTTSAAPIRVALARERRGSATWSVRGPADALWAVTRLQDQALSGQIQGEGELQFGAGYLAGDGNIEIVDGRFEDKLTGIVLNDLDALVSIGERGVHIERFTAAGARGGRLSASGGSADPQHGRIQVTLDNIWLADRGDARARGSGELALSWEGLDSEITGRLALAQAEVNIAQNPEAGIPTIDVVEINRPGDEDLWLQDEQANGASPRAASTSLNVTVTAPGRVFTRGRGIEAEWSLDLRLAGTAAKPTVFGEANIVRGQLALSGQPFDLERGRILFNGNPLSANVDILATRSTADLTANILITGSASAPEVALSSTPALPEDEILPQVLFGQSVQDLSPLEAAQIASALAALSGAASFDLVDAARAAAGLDRFNVRQDEDGGFLVSGGVYLTREVYVEVARTGLGQASTSVEWTLRPQLVLITSFLGNGDQRVSLRWRREAD